MTRLPLNVQRFVCCPECGKVVEVLEHNILVLHGCSRRLQLTVGGFQEYVPIMGSVFKSANVIGGIDTSKGIDEGAVAVVDADGKVLL